MDAIAPYMVRVAQEDIDTGIPGDTKNCAAVVGLKRHPDVMDAEIGRSRSYIKFIMYQGIYPGQWVRYKTPWALKEEFIAGDRGGKMYPQDFTFYPLAESELPTGRRQGSKTSENGKVDFTVSSDGQASEVTKLIRKSRARRKLIPGIRPPIKK
jgi:hypothetical protein